MKTFNTYYKDAIELFSFIKINSIRDTPSLLIQVFMGSLDKRQIRDILNELSMLLPQAVIIGATTDGEIVNGKVSTQKIALSFTQFEQTSLKVAIAYHDDDGYYSGRKIATELKANDLKLMISFADGLNTNGEIFLKGIDSINKSVIVAGGLAGDNSQFKKTFVFTKDAIIDNGAVAVGLYSKVLSIYNDYSFDWLSIGKLLTITKVNANRVYTINNKTAIEVYAYYLGEDIARGLPSIGIEFPLVTIRDGIKIARAVITKHSDGSLSFAGNLRQGDKVQFGYGNPTDILKHANTFVQTIDNHPSEAIFIYSCMARRHFMPELIETETLPLENTAPTIGFFTYGEFFSASKKELLNQSMTVISLSESKKILTKKYIEIEKNSIISSSTNALINLLNRTSQEIIEQEVLEKTKSNFEILFKQAPDGIVLIDGSQFIQCNQKIMAIFGYKSEEKFLNLTLEHLSPNNALILSTMKSKAIEKGSQHFECKFQKKSGKNFWADVMFTNIIINDKNILYMICRDISQKKELEFKIKIQKEKLYYQANRDTLTGFYNRNYIIKKLEKTINKYKETNNEFLLFFIDLDKFKRINDSLGHAIGDEVIKVAGKRISSFLRKSDILARLGGDEFLLLIRKSQKEKDLVNKVLSILQEIEEPMKIDYHNLYISASIGVSHYPIDSKNVNELLNYADVAMHQVKESGGNNVLFYSIELTDIVNENFMMEREIREGIDKDEFEVYYQPQIDLQSEKIMGFEALVRWIHPRKGFIKPDDFIPLAEKTGIIVLLDLWVMKKAMKQFSLWYKQGLNPGILALNVSIKQLESPNFIETIQETLKFFDFKERWLEIEIIETSFIENTTYIISVLHKLHDLGITIAIDDFGTGYSSLSYLQKLPIDKLKIDKSFISNVLHEKGSQAIVNTIVTLGKNLNLTVLAEGVELEVEKDFLLESGCDEVQGYYFSKPIPSEIVENRFLR